MVGSDAESITGITRTEEVYLRVQERLSAHFPMLIRLSIRSNRAWFRLSGGRIGGKMFGVPIALLTTTGRRSGRTRTVPVSYLDDGSRYLVVASNSGQDAPPAWLLNLRADPRAGMRTRQGRQAVVAHELSGSERDEMWPRLVRHNAMWGAYRSRTGRRIAVVALECPADQASG